MAEGWPWRRRFVSARALKNVLLTMLIFCAFVLGVQGVQALERGNRGVPTETSVESDRHLAYRYMTVGWFDWAAVHLAEIVNEHPDVESLMVLGMLLDELDDAEQAARAFKQAARLAAEDARAQSAAYTLLAHLHRKAGRTGEAEEAFSKALERSEGNAQAMFGRGLLAEEARRYDEAIGWYERAAQSSSEWIEPIVRASALLNVQGRFDRAAMLLKDAAHLGIWHPEYHYQLAVSYEGLLRRILDQDGLSEVYEALEALGVAAEEPGRWLKEHALHAVDRVKQLDSDHPGADLLLDRLRQL